MNKKGFTLIELIATIALLAIIAIIAFVSINKVIKENKKNNCEALINNLKTAARDYISDNRYEKDFINDFKANNDNNTIEVTQNIFERKYITTPITDPINNVEVTAKIHVFVHLKSDYTVETVGVEIDRDDGVTPRYTSEEWCLR